MAGWDVGEIANLGDEIAGLSATIVQREVMKAADSIGVVGNLVRKMPFPGAGLALNLPYINATEWSTAALAEGAQTTFADIDVPNKTATVVKYVIDWPISLEGASYGAANAVQAAIGDAGRGYAAKVDGLVHAAINADTDLDVTTTTTLTLAQIAAAKQKMITNKVPGPHFLALHGEHWTDLHATTSTMTALANPAAGMKGGNGYLGNILGFETYTCPHAVGTGVGASGTAAMSVFFGQDGVRYVYKPTLLPAQGATSVSNGEFGIRIWYSDEWRAWVISGTMFGVAVVVRSAETNPWCGNLYLSA